MPRLRHFLSTLSIAMYPLFARSLCMLCLHTITPIGSFEAESLEYAYRTIEVRNRRLLVQKACSPEVYLLRMTDVACKAT